MPTKKFENMAEFDKWFKVHAEEAIKKALLGTAMAVVNTITGEVIPAEPRIPVDRGIYRAAWKYAPLENGATVYNSAPYASIIEHGARAENIKPGAKMRAALEEWAIRKGIADSETAPSVAWAIAMSMKKKGIFNEGKGLKILEKGMKHFGKLLDREWKIAFKKAMGG